MFRVKSYFLKESHDPIISVLFAGTELMNIKRFADDISYGHTRIEACVRILENDLHLLAVGKHLDGYLLLFVKQDFSVVNNLSVCGLMQSQERSSRCRLAAAGFPYHS